MPNDRGRFGNIRSSRRERIVARPDWTLRSYSCLLIRVAQCWKKDFRSPPLAPSRTRLSAKQTNSRPCTHIKKKATASAGYSVDGSSILTGTHWASRLLDQLSLPSQGAVYTTRCLFTDYKLGSVVNQASFRAAGVRQSPNWAPHPVRVLRFKLKAKYQP